jgi:hypothetical protein
MGLLRSLLGKLGGSSEAPRPSSTSKPEIVRLANTSSEYEYVKRVKCRACGGATSSYRRGSETAKSFSYEGGCFRRGTMHDFWVFTCKSCKLKRELAFEVPGPSLEDLDNFSQQIDDGSIKMVALPSADEARRRFAGQTIDKQSVRQEVIKDLMEKLDLERNLEKTISQPMFILAAADLNLTEFVHAYAVLCTRLAMKNHDGGKTLTVQLPKVVMRALAEPHSSEARNECLDFLLRDD